MLRECQQHDGEWAHGPEVGHSTLSPHLRVGTEPFILVAGPSCVVPCLFLVQKVQNTVFCPVSGTMIFLLRECPRHVGGRAHGPDPRHSGASPYPRVHIELDILSGRLFCVVPCLPSVQKVSKTGLDVRFLLVPFFCFGNVAGILGQGPMGPTLGTPYPDRTPGQFMELCIYIETSFVVLCPFLSKKV